MCKGGRSLAAALISAPIRRSGVMMRAMGRRESDSSPCRSQAKSWPARSPQRSQYVLCRTYDQRFLLRAKNWFRSCPSLGKILFGSNSAKYKLSYFRNISLSATSCESATLTRGDSRSRLPALRIFLSDNSRLAGWYENLSGHLSLACFRRLHALSYGTKNGRGCITISIFQAEPCFRDKSFADG